MCGNNFNNLGILWKIAEIKEICPISPSVPFYEKGRDYPFKARVPQEAGASPIKSGANRL
ncbi:MAG: hypothetical protein CL524_08360 [Aequorivita sp.]|nr:hypothetical protein [Aequorivita sp.]|tara:strand:- start:1965 stop:2144 length:180 start_codon:yes stop_codon:yes gene_type:complete